MRLLRSVLLLSVLCFLPRVAMAGPMSWDLRGVIEYSDVSAFSGQPYQLTLTFDPSLAPLCEPVPSLRTFYTAARLSIGTRTSFGGLRGYGGYISFNARDNGDGPCDSSTYYPGHGWAIVFFLFPVPGFPSGESLSTFADFDFAGTPGSPPQKGGFLVAGPGSEFGALGSGEWSVRDTPVPEPSTWVLAATGLAAIGLVKRRQLTV